MFELCCVTLTKLERWHFSCCTRNTDGRSIWERSKRQSCVRARCWTLRIVEIRLLLRLRRSPMRTVRPTPAPCPSRSSRCRKVCRPSTILPLPLPFPALRISSPSWLWMRFLSAKVFHLGAFLCRRCIQAEKVRYAGIIIVFVTRCYISHSRFWVIKIWRAAFELVASLYSLVYIIFALNLTF